MTATISNPYLIDGINIKVQQPSLIEEEKRYLDYTHKDDYQDMEECRKRILELLHYYKDKSEYKKKTELAVIMVKEIEEEGNFPDAVYAFDNGVLNIELTKTIENNGKYWLSEIEKTRNIFWKDHWVHVENIDKELVNTHPESFRHIRIKKRNGKLRDYWVFTKTVRLKKYGRVKLAIVHENEDLSDNAYYLISNAKHWESKKFLTTWDYRWTIEIFHEFVKQDTGFESSQVRNEKSVNRHLCLSCLSQSLIQRYPCIPITSDRFMFSDGNITFGQKVLSMFRESFELLLSFIKNLFSKGDSVKEVLDKIIPI